VINGFCETEMPDAFPEFWHLGSHRYPMYLSKLHSLFEFCVRESSWILDVGCSDRRGYLLATPTTVPDVGLDIDRKNAKGSGKV